MRRELVVLLFVASCGNDLGDDVPSEGGVAEAGAESGSETDGAGDGGVPAESGSADADAAPYDAPADVQTRCSPGIFCGAGFGCCVQFSAQSCEEIGDCPTGTFLACSASSQCGAGRCCVRPDDAGIYIATGECRAACAPGDLVLCDPNDSPANNGCTTGQTCSGANLGNWGLADVDAYAGCQPP